MKFKEICKTVIERLEKVTGANNYPEKPNRLKNLGIGAIAGLILGIIAILVTSNTEVSLTVSYLILAVLAHLSEYYDKLHKKYFNFCHLAMKLAGGAVVIAILHGIF